MIEQTLILIKPDGIQRGLIGEITRRFEQRGLKIVGIKMTKAAQELAEQHYEESIAKKHGEKVRNACLEFITSSPVIAIAIEGSNAIATVRKIVGNTYPGEADIGTIRGDLAHASKAHAKKLTKVLANLVHASEDSKGAKRELALWFTQDELFDYKLSHEDHIL